MIIYNGELQFYENYEIYFLNKLKFHLKSQGKCKEMDRRRRKHGKTSREEGKRHG